MQYNDKVLVDEVNPYGLDPYTFVPVLINFTADTPDFAHKVFRLNGDLKSAQYRYNKLKVLNSGILESQQQGLKLKNETDLKAVMMITETKCEDCGEHVLDCRCYVDKEKRKVGIVASFFLSMFFVSMIVYMVWMYC